MFIYIYTYIDIHIYIYIYTASFVFYGVTCLMRLIGFAALFASGEEHVCYTSSVRQVNPLMLTIVFIVVRLLVRSRAHVREQGRHELGVRAGGEEADHVLYYMSFTNYY